MTRGTFGGTHGAAVVEADHVAVMRRRADGLPCDASPGSGDPCACEEVGRVQVDVRYLHGTWMRFDSCHRIEKWRPRFLRLPGGALLVELHYEGLH